MPKFLSAYVETHTLFLDQLWNPVAILTYLVPTSLYILIKSCRLGITDGISPSRWLWHKAEFQHINVLELKAIKIGIYTYCKNKDFLHVKVMGDNVTAISYVNDMGGRGGGGGIKSQTCNKILCKMWDFYSKN